MQVLGSVVYPPYSFFFRKAFYWHKLILHNNECNMTFPHNILITFIPHLSGSLLPSLLGSPPPSLAASLLSCLVALVVPVSLIKVS